MRRQQILFTQKKQDGVEPVKCLSQCGRDSETLRAVVNPLRWLSLERGVVWHEALFFIDKPVTSRDDLDGAGCESELMTKRVDAVHHVAVLPASVKSTGRKSPTGQFSLSPTQQNHVVEVSFREGKGTVPNVLFPVQLPTTRRFMAQN